MRRAARALALGAATTIVFACLMPHVWYLVFRPDWRYPSGGPSSLWSSGPPMLYDHQRRPFVDLYVITPARIREAGEQSSAALAMLPKWVRVSDDADAWTRIDTAGCGWPWRAMASEAWVPKPSIPVEFRWNLRVGESSAGPILIPLRPIWPGFAINSMVFACAWYPLLLLPFPGARWWREGHRLRRGRCPGCGYDLQWHLASGCPECGWRRAAHNNTSK